jgi:hypothetical protein
LSSAASDGIVATCVPLGVASDDAVFESTGGDTICGVGTGVVRMRFSESSSGSVVMSESSRGFEGAAPSVKVVCRNDGGFDKTVGRVALGVEADVAPIFSRTEAFFVSFTFGREVKRKCNSEVCRIPSGGGFDGSIMGELDPVEPPAELTGDDDKGV